MNNKTHHTPAYPTFPISDKLGQVIMHFGASKLEMGAFMIAAGIAHHIDNLLPETVADMSIEIARAIIDKCDEQLNNETKTGNASILV
jgi:hypothetical protein